MSSNQLDPRTMADAQSVSNYARPGVPGYEAFPQQSAWVGWIDFAGVMLIMLASFHAIQGLVALFRDEVYVVGKNGLVLNLDYTAWGWLHIALGALGIAVGACLLAGQMWARVVAVGIAFLSALANIAFLPAYPVWSSLMIAFDIIVIWAVMVHGGELRRSKDA